MDLLRVIRPTIVAGLALLLTGLTACADDGNADNANIVDFANPAATETTGGETTGGETTGGETTGGETRQRFEIEIVNFQFAPAQAVVPAGTEVVWINNDTDVHSIVSTGGLFQNSEIFAPGESFSVVLADEGSYAYTCGVHPFMLGSITVEG
jgi:plastocyanin